MRRSRALSNWPGSFFAARSWAGCTTNMFGFDLRQAQASASGLIILANQILVLSLLKTGLRSRSRVGAALKRPALGFSIAIGVIIMIGTSGRIALGSSSRPLIGVYCRLARGDFL